MIIYMNDMMKMVNKQSVVLEDEVGVGVDSEPFCHLEENPAHPNDGRILEMGVQLMDFMMDEGVEEVGELFELESICICQDIVFLVLL